MYENSKYYLLFPGRNLKLATEYLGRFKQPTFLIFFKVLMICLKPEDHQDMIYLLAFSPRKMVPCFINRLRVTGKIMRLQAQGFALYVKNYLHSGNFAHLRVCGGCLKLENYNWHQGKYMGKCDGALI